MHVKTTITWPIGRITQRLVDWSRRCEVANFSRVSKAALAKGATVTTKMVEEAPS